MKMGRPLFIALIVLLVATIVALSVVTLSQGPRVSLVEMIEQNGNTAQVNDIYEGAMTIPFYNIPINSYRPDDFYEEDGVVQYAGNNSVCGINVNSKSGDIDWQQVKDSGVDFAMIRVGFREYIKGRIHADSNFTQNIEGAIKVGLPVGVYFYSQAVTNAEADQEAQFVIEQIRNYSMTYPVVFYWEYKLKEDGSQDESSRTVRCNGDQVTGFIDTFCGKIRTAGLTPAYYADKNMAYNYLDLSRISGYDLWYAEYKPVPSFYYDFKMWQYTKEGNVPGIAVDVPITIAMEKY